ncbi:chaperone protein HtpG [Gordonia hirsuta DSM 44140 = NBRC 16056]|uniref:Chaperone protein HtpG n=1 Tax=Gordonia hirsuta DSM 44140 = NBRC 16056 TaxID=1121927 RepID=L7L7Q1_9ACTN|nr:molecular chaperone HtpG [Gordonia hirsuta]GAC56067.1 chaperone protein HtpG [Gordonia hirsuta DSM 44140 = NBRC 16056]
MSSQVHEFQAEARQLLDLVVHSIYSNKDSFLRELISNASDALDKLRLESLTNTDLDADTSDLHVRLTPDTQARTLTVADNGIGMGRDEVVDLIGTVAKSGTAKLRQALSESGDAAASEELIGQFGIGFYSVFMVADRVVMVTRKAGESIGTRWESTGDGTYTIDDAADAPQGTSITLTLKPVDTDNSLHDYADPQVLRSLVKRYSDFISWPIRMFETVEVPAEEEGGEPTQEQSDVTLNSQKALWAKIPSEVAPEEYAEFYRHVSHQWDSPLETISMHAEGTFEYQALMFIPSQAPMTMFAPERPCNLQLYVRRVFISDDVPELLPTYLRFVHGVVDANDLSLNVSREILQQDRQIRAIRRRLVKKVIGTVQEMQDRKPEDYAGFWNNFGAVFKEGLAGDQDNFQAILKASVFDSTASDDERTTLADYIERCPAEQKVIYYMTGESRKQIERSPHLEGFRAKGIEVLLLSDPVDEFWTSQMPEFDGRTFVSVAKGEAGLDDEDDDAGTDRDAEFADLLTWLTGVLDADVSTSRLTKRLTDSAACLVGEEFSISPQMEKLYRASGQEIPHMKRVLELNPDHPLVTGLAKAYASGGEDHGDLEPTAKLIYAMALLAEGGELADPAEFARLLSDTLVAGLE